MSNPQIVWVSPTLLIALQAQAIAVTGGTSGLRDRRLLESALDRGRNLLAYSDTPSSIFQLASACAYGIARNHPFVDGNKRAAVVLIRAFLHLNGWHFSPDQAEGVVMIEGLAAGTVDEGALCEWIGRSARRRTSTEAA